MWWSSTTTGPGRGVLPACWGISTWEWHKLCMMAPALFTDEAWTEVIDTLTVAAIRFELLSTAHRGQVGQQLAWSHAWQVVGTVE